MTPGFSVHTDQTLPRDLPSQGGTEEQANTCFRAMAGEAEEGGLANGKTWVDVILPVGEQ